MENIFSFHFFFPAKKKQEREFKSGPGTEKKTSDYNKFRYYPEQK